MGYTTDFDGAITIEPPLNDAERDYLRKFSESRRMQRERGPYYVDGSGYHGQGRDEDVTDYNRAPDGQPGLWCHWTPSEDGAQLEWDEGEKFYDSPQWMAYVIDHFLRPDAHAKGAGDAFAAFTFDHVCNGEIFAQGEDPDDKWKLTVTDNAVNVVEAIITYEQTGDGLDDSEALNNLARFLWEDAEQFPGGADTCEALDAELRRTGRKPDEYHQDQD